MSYTLNVVVYAARGTCCWFRLMAHFVNCCLVSYADT